jgi:hypothetical protein
MPFDVVRQIQFFATEPESEEYIVVKDAWSRFWIYTYNCRQQQATMENFRCSADSLLSHR